MSDHDQSKSFSCCLIGGDTLLTQCGEQLLEAGHDIIRVITDAASVIAWARGHAIEVVPATSDYARVLQALEFDYLFAITHLALIPDNAVNTPRKGAINFHDGPLPMYAGLNTPMWALLNGETSYGITWHVMSEGIDTGDILLTEPVTIAPEDSAVSLNTKCFTAALDSFPRLLDAIESDTLAPQPQDLEKRQYFGRADHPERLCILDWRQPAKELERLVRALNTGRYENPLGTPKIFIGKTPYIVSAGQIRTDLSSTAPGSILEAGEQSITIACGQDAFEITQVTALHGEQKHITDLQLTVGMVLNPPAEMLEVDSTSIGKQENFWLRRLIRAEAISLPYRSSSGKTDLASQAQQRAITIPEALSSYTPHAIAGAFISFLSRVTGNEEVCVAFSGGELSERALAAPGLLKNFGVDHFAVNYADSAKNQVNKIADRFAKHLSRQPWLGDLVARQPNLRANNMFVSGGILPLLISVGANTANDPVAELSLQVTADNTATMTYLPGAYSSDAVERMAINFENWLTDFAQRPNVKPSDLDIMSASERQSLITELNDTSMAYDKDLLMHSSFEAQASRTPDAVAVVANDRSMTYGELNAAADKTAGILRHMGAGPDNLVGIYVGRSADLLIATLGVLKAGAAYVPLDPAFPADRIEFMIEDSAMPIVICDSTIQENLPACDAALLQIDKLSQIQEPEPATALRHARPDSLAYVIYTSGSTGKPKGVMLEHRNVVNFFVAMDKAVPDAANEERTWLAVTSLSFDISVLELFWTLNRGFKVVVHDESSSRKSDAVDIKPTRALDMGLFMWGNDDAAGADKYRLLMEGARFFDENGFSAVWTPERHFHAFGGPYPNPAVTGAAVAAITQNVKIRAGSCVVPLHHPVRIAEEWGVVDNLSNGRVEIAAASGWNPNDFVLRPENHAENKRVMYDQLDQVRRLWRGEKLTFDGPMGAIEVESLPRPVQKELPCWITTAGSPETWQEAGRLGHNVLTHLLGQSVDEVADKIRLYRAARAKAGHNPEDGKVALMLHTFIGDEDADVKERVRGPMKDYLSSSMRLAMDYAWAFPAFKRPGGDNATPDEVDLNALNDEEVDTILDFAFERYFETSGLFGCEDTCLTMLNRCAAAGVDEIGCLLDFGVDTQDVLDSLPRIKSLRDRMLNAAQSSNENQTPLSLAELVETHQVTHLQCTPSTARMYLTDQESRQAFASIPHLLLGGEALPVNLAQEIKSLNPGTLTNMYGPTETTIWSMTSAIDDPAKGITIGTPIANTQVYVLDKHLNPVPTGIPGELYIGGDGVARGYLNRAELTAERFVNDPFSDDADARIYATGDLAMYREDGAVDYLGRTDFQVKVRGYRIELGEIEARLEGLRAITEAAVIVRAADVGDERMVGYVTMAPGAALNSAELREELRSSLPEYMIPNEFVSLEYMPRTANGKLDRKALADIKPAITRTVEQDAAPTSELEKTIAELWRKVLKLDAVGLNENFFDLGGHSLLVVQLHGHLKQSIERPVSLTDLYQYTTIKSLAEFLTSGGDDSNIKQSLSRGQQRRALRRRRA